MGRTRRVAIDGGFSQHGNSWDSSGNFSFSASGHVQFSLPFAINLGGYGINQASVVTLWNDGVLSLGSATQAQIDFMQTGASPIPSASNAGFPGLFFLFDHQEGASYDSYSFGIGVVDYTAPYNLSQAVKAAFFTYENGFQIVLDMNGFSILAEPSVNSNTNGYYIGGLGFQEAGQEIQFGQYPDFLTYHGTAAADTQTGTEFGDVFVSSPGSDHIDGQGGIDLIKYAASPSGVTVDLSLGTGSGGDAEGDQLAGIEDLYGSGYADTITGSDAPNSLFGRGSNDTISGGNGDDTISGDLGNDTIEGGAGADLLFGGSGTDTLSYLGSSAGVTVSLANSTAMGGDATGDIVADFERLIGSEFADLLQASGDGNQLTGEGGDDVILGSTGVDSLYGGAGDDYLTGGAGADTLDGGDGSDTVNYGDSLAALTIDLGANAALGGDAAGDHLSSIENVIGTAFADALTGSLDDNRLDGGNGNDTLYGREGGDILLGDAGADKLFGEDGNDTLLGGDGNDTLSGSDGLDILSGGAGADVLTGDRGNDILAGESGNDSLKGGSGADTMTGGTGDDLFYVDNPGDIVIESTATAGGNDHVIATISYTLAAGVEQLSINSSASMVPINLTGNGLTNTITGNSVANVIDGRGGADYMAGGAGGDLYIVDNIGDVVVEQADNGPYGVDQVNSSLSYQLPDYVENLVLTGSASIDGTGNELGNSINGNSGNNILDGGAGADVMYGYGGDDIFIVDNASDLIVVPFGVGGYDIVKSSVSYQLPDYELEAMVLTGTEAIDGTGNNFGNFITGNSANNVLDGGGNADTLSGGAGDDTLNGGDGSDTLTGGVGHDVYVFADTLGAIEVDTINGYSVSADVIYLDHSAFGGLTPGALAAGAFNTGTAASEGDDRIIYDSASGALYFDADGSDPGGSYEFAVVSPGLAMSAAEFYVV